MHSIHNLDKSCRSKHLTTEYDRNRRKLLTTDLCHHRTIYCYCIFIAAVIKYFDQGN